MTPRQPTLLLVEPMSLLRRTVAAVARDLNLAAIHECTSIAAADRLLATTSFDALVVALDVEGRALDLLHRVRTGQTQCQPSAPVVVLADACDASLALRLKELEVRRLLLKPFKVKGVLEGIGSLWKTDAGDSTAKQPCAPATA